MKRLAVFRGRVMMGGRTYEVGEHWVRPQDVQSLIEAGTVRWADASAKSKRKAPRKRERKRKV